MSPFRSVLDPDPMHGRISCRPALDSSDCDIQASVGGDILLDEEAQRLGDDQGKGGEQHDQWEPLAAGTSIAREHDEKRDQPDQCTSGHQVGSTAGVDSQVTFPSLKTGQRFADCVLHVGRGDITIDVKAGGCAPADEPCGRMAPVQQVDGGVFKSVVTPCVGDEWDID
jgi:hypothetical protein